MLVNDVPGRTPKGHPLQMSETLRVYLEPLFATPEALRNIERWFSTYQDCGPTVELEPVLLRLQAPTLVVWGTDDVYFPVKWAYWLRDTIPGCRKVIEVEDARLFFPEERPEELAKALLEQAELPRLDDPLLARGQTGQPQAHEGPLNRLYRVALLVNTLQPHSGASRAVLEIAPSVCDQLDHLSRQARAAPVRVDGDQPLDHLAR